MKLQKIMREYQSFIFYFSLSIIFPLFYKENKKSLFYLAWSNYLGVTPYGFPKLLSRFLIFTPSYIRAYKMEKRCLFFKHCVLNIAYLNVSLSLNSLNSRAGNEHNCFLLINKYLKKNVCCTIILFYVTWQCCDMFIYVLPWLSWRLTVFWTSLESDSSRAKNAKQEVKSSNLMKHPIVINQETTRKKQQQENKKINKQTSNQIKRS